MKRVRTVNDHNSDVTSPTKRRPPPLKKSERAFLSDQAADARAAMSRTLDDMGDTLKRIVDVRSHAKRHPWLVVGSAVAAGFIASALFTPALRKSSKTAGKSAASVPPSSRYGRTTSPTKKSSLFSTATRLLAGIVQTVVVNRLIAGIVAAQDRRPVEAPSPGPAGEVERVD